MTDYFSISREKDENELLKQMQVKFHNLVESSNLTLNLININQAYTCVETIFINLKHRIDDDKKVKIQNNLNYFLKCYHSIKLGSKNDSFDYMIKLNKNVKDLYVEIMEALN